MPLVLVVLCLIFPAGLQLALASVDWLLTAFYGATFKTAAWVYDTAFNIKISTGYGNLDGLLAVLGGGGLLILFSLAIVLYFSAGGMVAENFGRRWSRGLCDFLAGLPCLLFFLPLLSWAAIHVFVVVLVNPVAWLFVPDKPAPKTAPAPIPTALRLPSSTLDLPKPPYDLKALRAKYKITNDYMTAALIMGGGAYKMRFANDGKIYRGYHDVFYKVDLVSEYDYRDYVRKMRFARGSLRSSTNPFLHIYILPPLSLISGGVSKAGVMKLADNRGTRAKIYQICYRNQLSPTTIAHPRKARSNQKTRPHKSPTAFPDFFS